VEEKREKKRGKRKKTKDITKLTLMRNEQTTNISKGHSRPGSRKGEICAIGEPALKI
jgi:hypothetical protein